MKRARNFAFGLLAGGMIAGASFVAAPAAACDIIYFGCISCLNCGGEVVSCHINEANPRCIRI